MKRKPCRVRGCKVIEEDKPMCFRGLPYCSDNHRKILEKQGKTKVSKQSLKQELQILLAQVNEQMEILKKEALRQGIIVNEMRHMDGTWAITQLLVAKAQILASLALLETDRNA